MLNLRNTLFRHPVRTSAGVGVSSGIILLILTSLRLTPLGNNDRDAKSERDDARNKYDGTYQKLKSIYAKISDDRQRILDLDCAFAGYQGFNQAIDTFQQQIKNSTASSINVLKSFWQMYFTPDKTETEKSVAGKSWDEDYYVYESFYSCSHSDPCPKKGDSCCYETGWHWITETFYYNQLTTITDKYKNIITGSPFHVPSLNCGHYSRQFQTFAPDTYLTYESPHIDSGDRRAGTTYVDFYREYGSRVKLSFLLDENTTPSTLNVLRNVNVIDAANDLSANLFKFLGLAVATFKLTGANYPALQESFREEIPKLFITAAEVNATLQEEAIVLAEKQAIFDSADGEFQGGLKLWLPLFFLLPGGLALLTFCMMSACKNMFCNDLESARRQIQNDLESGFTSSDADKIPAYEPPTPPPAYNPALFGSGSDAAVNTAYSPFIDEPQVEGQRSATPRPV